MKHDPYNMEPWLLAYKLGGPFPRKTKKVKAFLKLIGDRQKAKNKLEKKRGWLTNSTTGV